MPLRLKRRPRAETAVSSDAVLRRKARVIEKPARDQRRQASSQAFKMGTAPERNEQSCRMRRARSIAAPAEIDDAAEERSHT